MNKFRTRIFERVRIWLQVCGSMSLGRMLRPWPLVAMVLGVNVALAQDALRYSLPTTAPRLGSQRSSEPENQPYTLKYEDFRLLVAPSLGLDWNDNVKLSKSDPADDFILRPALGLKAIQPFTSRNELHLSATIGYDKYFEHDELSRLRVESGSEVGWDVFVK